MFALLLHKFLSALAGFFISGIRVYGAIRATSASGAHEMTDVVLRLVRVGPKGGVYAIFEPGQRGLPTGEFSLSPNQIQLLNGGARIGVRVTVGDHVPVIFLQRDRIGGGPLVLDVLKLDGKSLGFGNALRQFVVNAA